MHHLLTKCITKIDGRAIDDAENLDLVMLIYNLRKCSSNYSGATRILWFSSKDKATDFDVNIENIDNFKSSKYEAKLIRNIVAESANGILKKLQLRCN